MLKTNCAICGAKLIEEADFDSDEEGFMITYLSCPKCEALVKYEYNVELLELNSDVFINN